MHFLCLGIQVPPAYYDRVMVNTPVHASLNTSARILVGWMPNCRILGSRDMHNAVIIDTDKVPSEKMASDHPPTPLAIPPPMLDLINLCNSCHSVGETVIFLCFSIMMVVVVVIYPFICNKFTNRKVMRVQNSHRLFT